MPKLLEEPRDEDLSIVMEAFYAQFQGTKTDKVTFTSIHQHNALNYTFSGTIETDLGNKSFIIRDGDWNGTEVVEWGNEDDVGMYRHPAPDPLNRIVFVPNDPMLHVNRPHMWRVYMLWRQTKAFREKEDAYLYDRHFQPGLQIENYYRNWARPKGLVAGTLRDIPEQYREAAMKDPK